MPRENSRRFLNTDDFYIVLLLCALALFLVSGRREGAVLEVSMDGKSLKYGLEEERLIDLPTEYPMVIQVTGGKAFIAQTDCPRQICRGMGAISRQGEVIVCVPNRTVIRIIGPKEGGSDSVTR